MALVLERGATSASSARTLLSRLGSPAGAVAVLTAAAFALRLSQLDQSLYGDEVLAYHEILGHSLGGTVHTVAIGVESSPPLFFILAWLSSKLGDPTVWIRLPSLILGAATIPLVYLVGRETVGRRAGAIAAAALAVSPFSTYYGIEARPYATLAFFVTFSTLALLRAASSDGWRWWALYAIAAAAAAYAHYTAIFVLAAQVAWALMVCRDRIREPLVATAAAALLYVPWLPHLHGSNLSVYGTYEPLTAHNVVIDLLHVVPGYPYTALHAIPTLPGLAAIAACALAGLIALAVRVRTRLGERLAGASPPALIVLLAAATPIGLLLYSRLATDIWDARSLYASVPAAVLVLGAALAALPRPVWLAATVVVLGVMLAGTIRALGPSYARPPYRSVASYLDRVAGPRDPIIVYPSLFYLNFDVEIELHAHHLLINGMPKRWPATPAGHRAYVILDDKLDQVLKIPYPRQPGFQLIAARTYRGLSRFTLLTYRAVGG